MDKQVGSATEVPCGTPPSSELSVKPPAVPPSVDEAYFATKTNPTPPATVLDRIYIFFQWVASWIVGCFFPTWRPAASLSKVQLEVLNGKIKQDENNLDAIKAAEAFLEFLELNVFDPAAVYKKYMESSENFRKCVAYYIDPEHPEEVAEFIKENPCDPEVIKGVKNYLNPLQYVIVSKGS